jgi:RNA polymerase sigma factor (sigma-70 family)
MSDEAVNTVQLLSWVDRLRAGDLAARDELLRAVCGRLERLARKMLRRFPSVQRWAQTDDVLQNALLRLLRALEHVRPDSVRDFFGLAAEQMRRELLDMARHFHGPRGAGAHHHSAGGNDVTPVENEADEASEGGDNLDKWAAFHAAVAGLPAEEREVVGLIYYHGWEQKAVADLFQCSVRTVQRRWEAALQRLHAELARQGF